MITYLHNIFFKFDWIIFSSSKWGDFNMNTKKIKIKVKPIGLLVAQLWTFIKGVT